MSVKEIIEKSGKAKDYYEKAKEEMLKAQKELEQFKVEEPDDESMRLILERCEGKTYTKTYLFVAVSMLRYAPLAIHGGKLPLSLARRLSGILGITYNNIYMIRNKVSVWLVNYADFYSEVSEIYKGV